IAGPPQRLEKAKPTETEEEPPEQPGRVPPPTNPRQPAPNPEEEDDEDDEDDGDDSTPNDPLKHLFESVEPGASTLPIVGVAPRVKGKAIRPLYGLDRYEDWVFIFVPDPRQVIPAIPRRPGTRVSP
ncbi:MAG TPA: hypothetical protein VLU47_16320, partial [Blastocatellia bacterium]|nr:hypothetical protein [Blastocatellia bacterium]